MPKKEVASEERNDLAQLKEVRRPTVSPGSDAVMPPAAGQKYSVGLTMGSPRYFLTFSVWIRKAVIFAFLLLPCATYYMFAPQR